MARAKLLVCVFLFVGIPALTLGQGRESSLASNAGSCDIIQRSDSPCVLLPHPEITVLTAPHREFATATGRIMLPAGTPVDLRLTRRLHARNLTPHVWGQRVELEVVSDVVVDDHVVIAAGAEAWGSISDSSKAPGRFFAPGVLDFAVEGTRAVNGDIVPLSGTLDVEGDPFTCYDRACIYFFLAVGPFMKGDDAVAGKGAKILARVEQTSTFNMAEIEKIPVVHRVSGQWRYGEDGDRALIVVYRPEDDGCRGTTVSVTGAVRPTACGKARISIDDNQEMLLPGGKAVEIVVSPGHHHLSTPKGEAITLDVKGRTVRYVRLVLSTWKRRVEMEPVNSEIGDEESYPLDRVNHIAGAPADCLASVVMDSEKGCDRDLGQNVH